MNAHLSVRVVSSLVVLCFSIPSIEADEHRQLHVVAHRGLLLDAPENTLANMRACLELQIGFELDVRRSSDGHLVCVHDETVDRTTDGQGKVSDLTLEQLQLLDAGGWFDPKFRGQRIPTLDEVFAVIARHTDSSVLVAIDVKGDDKEVETDVVQLANRHKVLGSLVMIGRAIDDADVRKRLRQSDKRAHVACLANVPDEFAAALADGDSDWVYVRYIPSRNEVERAHAADKRVFLAGPTVAGQESQNWRRAAIVGLDAILTDYAAELQRDVRRDQRRKNEIRAELEPHFSPPDKFRDDFGEYRSARKFADGTEATNAEQWQHRRGEILNDWHNMLGQWPPLLDKPRIKILASERRENFIQQCVHVEIYPGEKYTEGHLLIPDGKGPFPAVLVTFYDSATSVGLGEKGRDTHDYGIQLARRGFVTLSIGTPGSIELAGRATRDLLTDAGEQQDRQPLSTLAYVAANCHTALAQMPEVDETRIGVVGLSYGGKWAMFASCLYDKFACAVWSDPGIVFNEKNANVNYWEPWYLGYEDGVRRPAGIPNDERPRTGLYKRLVESKRDLNELHALMCPRPVLVAGGTEDPPANWRALNHLVEINRMLGYSKRVAMTSRPTHVPTPEALETSLMFLEYYLKYN